MLSKACRPDQSPIPAELRWKRCFIQLIPASYISSPMAAAAMLLRVIWPSIIAMSRNGANYKNLKINCYPGNIHFFGRRRKIPSVSQSGRKVRIQTSAYIGIGKAIRALPLARPFRMIRAALGAVINIGILKLF